MFRKYLEKIEREEDVRMNLIELQQAFKNRTGQCCMAAGSPEMSVSDAEAFEAWRCQSQEECGIDSWRNGMSGCPGCPVLCL